MAITRWNQEEELTSARMNQMVDEVTAEITENVNKNLKSFNEIISKIYADDILLRKNNSVHLDAEKIKIIYENQTAFFKNNTELFELCTKRIADTATDEQITAMVKFLIPEIAQTTLSAIVTENLEKMTTDDFFVKLVFNFKRCAEIAKENTVLFGRITSDTSLGKKVLGAYRGGYAYIKSQTEVNRILGDISLFHAVVKSGDGAQEILMRDYNTLLQQQATAISERVRANTNLFSSQLANQHDGVYAIKDSAETTEKHVAFYRLGKFSTGSTAQTILSHRTGNEAGRGNEENLKDKRNDRTYSAYNKVSFHGATAREEGDGEIHVLFYKAK